ncbi:MAG: methanogenesis marker 14 protein [Candidatus Thorarchaeota archaeon]
MRKDRVVRPRSIGVSSLRKGPFYTVASVELGNTTTKCVLVTTNLTTAEVYEIEKQIRMTRDVRPPKETETVFGSTVFGVELTRESVSELVSDILISTIQKARLDIERDLHFVVRSTGVTASFASPTDVGAIVHALADGCLNAGIPPRKMTASISSDNLPADIQEYTWLHKVYFDGAVASSLPPSNTEIVANEMEGELVTAGLKGAAKSTVIDFRNPVITLDFGTTLAGRVTDNGYPYAKTTGSFAGLAGAIPDALAKGSGLVDEKTGCVLDIPQSSRSQIMPLDSTWEEEAHRIVRVKRVSKTEDRFGTVPVDARAAAESGTILIGVDAGTNGSGLDDLAELGLSIVESGGTKILLAVIDVIQAGVVQRILSLAETEGLILKETSLGLTGRAIISGQKPKLITENLHLNDGSLWVDKHEVLFVEDGLAMGAAVAARCMNSMGTTKYPMGGRKGDRCIMSERMKLQKSGRG